MPRPCSIFFSSQSGALFGLDARIALAVFSIISVVVGASMVLNMDTTRAKSLASELTDTTRAIESLHNDLQTDIFQSLVNPSEKNAFQALFDNAVITEDDNLRHRWNGPYIKFTSTVHPRYGEMTLTKRGPGHTEECTDNNICYLWLVYHNVRTGVITETNELLDGAKEAEPETSGRIQWSNGDEERELYYRAARALTSQMHAD